MKTKYVIVLGSILLLAVGTVGYWLGTQAEPGQMAVPSSGMTSPGKILYYRNPMGLPDTSPVPKKDSMGMDYVPVYVGDDAGSSSQVSISIEKIQKLGVKSEPAALRTLDKSIRATGRIEIDERRIYTIAPKFEGWVERLYVNTTGQSVGKGQSLFDVYSPELISAQREYALATQGEAALNNADQDARDSMKQLAEASRMRLKNWDIGDAQIGQSQDGKQIITFRAPVSGIVLDKKSVQGMRFMPGEMLYQIADLSSVWVIAEVTEQDIGAVRVGDVAQVRMDAYPDKAFSGRISFVYPTMNTSTRTVQVRIEVANPKGLLKPAMFANVKITGDSEQRVLTVPTSAVIDSGIRQLVLVQLAEGRYEPRKVRLGSRGEQYVEVIEGIKDGEQVVTSALFLLDSESNLKAALGGLNNDQAKSTSTQSKSVGHTAHGKFEEIYEDGSVSITHEPIKALGWPAMTMDFELSNPSLAKGIQSGSAIDFEIVERGEGEWVITKMKAATSQREGY